MKHLNILFVGLAGVPFANRAADIRIASTIKLFRKRGHSTLLLNKYFLINNLEDTSTNNPYNDFRVNYVIKKNPKNSFQKLGFHIYSLFKEYGVINRLNKKQKINIIHVYSGHFIEILNYWLISKLIKTKIIYHYVEFTSAINRNSIYFKLNGLLIDNYVPYIIDGCISISHFIESNVKKIRNNIPIIIIPPICDFDDFDKILIIEKNDLKYFLFCGSADYTETIDFIIRSFEATKYEEYNYKLLLVVSGTTKQIYSIRRRTEKLKDHVNILVNLTYENLIRRLKNSSGLLIPLNETIRDIARFPNKICEYVACHSVIITTPVGEIPYYFTHNKDALITNNVSIKEYSSLLNYVMENEGLLESLRDNSYYLGRRFFDISSYESLIDVFLNKL